MIVERWEHRIKAGHLEEAIDLLLSFKWVRPFRAYRARVGVLHRLVIDVEYENMADIEKAWEEIESTSGYESFLKKWQSVIISTERTFLSPVETSR